MKVKDFMMLVSDDTAGVIIDCKGQFDEYSKDWYDELLTNYEKANVLNVSADGAYLVLSIDGEITTW